MSEINELRKRVYQLQRRTDAKVGRLGSQKNVREGGKIDPRKPGKWVAHASSRELNAQIKRLETFNSAKTQFFGDASGRPMSKASWGEYKKVEKELNKWRGDFFDSVKGTRLANGATIEQAVGLRGYKYHAKIDDFVKEKNVDHTAFTSEKALKRRTAELRKMNREGAKGMTTRARDHFASIAADSMMDGLPLVDRVKGLSDDQFLVLWTSTDFQKQLSTAYQALRAGLLDKYNTEPYELALENANELLDWVSSPKTVRALNKAKDKRGTVPAKGRASGKGRRR